MPKYVVLVSWTDQGMRDVKETTRRTDTVRQLIERFGGTMDTVLWTQGRYDLVCVMDLPDDESFAAVGLQVGMMGAVRTESMRAFTGDEMDGILGRLG